MIELPVDRVPLGRLLLPAERTPAAWHAGLTEAISRHLTPAFAAILAEPRAGPDGVTWHTDATAVRRAVDLEPQDRQALLRAVGAILSEIRRLAESGQDRLVTEAWPALRQTPGIEQLFAVDGRPVLAGWGFAPARSGASILAEFDDGRPWRARPCTPWGVYATSLLGLGAVALAAGLLLPVAGARLFPTAPLCRASADSLTLLREASSEADRGALLRQELARLQEDYGRRALQCALPTLPPPPQPPSPPLAEDRWKRHDLSMLEGCWSNTTQLDLREQATQRVLQAERWTMCFDRNGHGKQTIELDDGRSCENPMAATFLPDDRVQLDATSRCPFARAPLLRGRMTCRHETDTEAACQYSDAEGPGAFRGAQPGRFHRAERN